MTNSGFALLWQKQISATVHLGHDYEDLVKTKIHLTTRQPSIVIGTVVGWWSIAGVLEKTGLDEFWVEDRDLWHLREVKR
jgi:hypothetical protein